MPAADPSPSAIARWLLRLGLDGMVLLAAFIVDLAILLPATFDQVGPKGIDLWVLPGMLAIAWCALWAKHRPVAATFAGSAALIGNTVLIRMFDVPPLSTLMDNASFTETVAAVQLLVLCVRKARADLAFVASTWLVLASVLSVLGRTYDPFNGDTVRTFAIGVVLVVGGVGFGVYSRRTDRETALPSAPLPTLVREQWPMIGLLSLPLFLELSATVSAGAQAVPATVFSAATAVTAVFSTRRPVPSALATAAIIAGGAAVTLLLGMDEGSANFTGIPLGEVVAGMIVVNSLVRWETQARVLACIGTLSAAVAFGTVATLLSGPDTADLDNLVRWFIAGALLLGIAMAMGLYFRARDRERAQLLSSAVSEAQTTERMALARELHDVVAHHVTGIVVQAQAARLVAKKDPQVVDTALGAIEAAGTEAMVAMRRLVGSMRGEPPAGSSGFSEQATTDLSADLRALAEGAAIGLPVRTELDLPESVPHELGRSVLRLVQESLTNVGKHAAGATQAIVDASVRDGELHVRVTDDGIARTPHPAGGSGGYGLVGMRERVDLLHGRFAAGPGPDGGWQVLVWLPFQNDESPEDE